MHVHLQHGFYKKISFIYSSFITGSPTLPSFVSSILQQILSSKTSHKALSNLTFSEMWLFLWKGCDSSRSCAKVLAA